jgi:hypothetical protein
VSRCYLLLVVVHSSLQNLEERMIDEKYLACPRTSSRSILGNGKLSDLVTALSS